MLLGRTQEIFDPKKIKKCRMNAGVTVPELALKTGLRKATIYRLERETEGLININIIVAIAEALNCTLQDFLIDGVELAIRPKENNEK